MSWLNYLRVATLFCVLGTGKADKYLKPQHIISEKPLSQKFSTAELKMWLEKETGAVLRPVQDKAQEHLDHTRSALQNLTEASKMLLDNSQKEIEKRNMKVYNRARALNKLAAMFIERIKKLKPPEQVSFDNLSAYANETQKTLAVIEIDIRNWFPRISPFFIMDRRKFLPVFDKTKQTASSLVDFLNKEYVKSKTLEKTFHLIAEVQALEAQLAEIEVVRERLRIERLALENEMTECEEQSTQIKGKEVIDQVARLDAEQETLNNELKQELRHLQKPFLKMQALATYGGGGGITPDELRMIGLYMENPFEAIVADQYDCAVLSGILGKLEVMLAEDKLKLKPEKQRKAVEAIEAFKKTDTVLKLQVRSVEVATRKRQLLESAEMEEAKRNLSQNEEKIEALRVRKGNVEADERLRESQRQEVLERVASLKRAIEANVQSFMGKSIQLQ